MGPAASILFLFLTDILSDELRALKSAKRRLAVPIDQRGAVARSGFVNNDSD